MFLKKVLPQLLLLLLLLYCPYFIADFQSHAIQNRSIDKVQNLGNKRRFYSHL